MSRRAGPFRFQKPANRRSFHFSVDRWHHRRRMGQVQRRPGGLRFFEKGHHMSKASRTLVEPDVIGYYLQASLSTDVPSLTYVPLWALKLVLKYCNEPSNTLSKSQLRVTEGTWCSLMNVHLWMYQVVNKLAPRLATGFFDCAMWGYKNRNSYRSRLFVVRQASGLSPLPHPLMDFGDSA